MNRRGLKIIFLLALCLTFVSTVGAQVNTCYVKLDPVMFVEGTTDTKLIDGVVFTIKKGKETLYESPSYILFEDVPEGTYQVSATKPGFRTTNDFIFVDCSFAQQGTAAKMIIMWEGDPAKTVDYAWVRRSRSKAGSSDRLVTFGAKDRPADAAVEPSTGAVVTEKQRPVNGEEISLAKVDRIDDPASPGAPAAGNMPANTVEKGVINGSAVTLAKPKYPPAAKAVAASGAVSVQVIIDEDGYVIAAKAVSGHPLLKASSVLAAKASRFMPTFLSGEKVRVSGIIIYNFQ